MSNNIYLHPGELRYTYKMGLPHSTSDVKFHPHDNYVAVSAFGSSHSVQFYCRQDTVQELPDIPGSCDVTWDRMTSRYGVLRHDSRVVWQVK